MPSVNDLRESKYLKKEDVGNGALVTVKGYEQKNVAQQGQAPDLKWVLLFHEFEKGMVLNPTNGQLLEQITGSGDFDHWIGKKVVLYNDPSIAFAGKIVGGIRIRAPRNMPAQNVPQARLSVPTQERFEEAAPVTPGMRIPPQVQRPRAGDASGVVAYDDVEEAPF